jgi:ADP-ribose pyrophosphatase YjhB (NUDIX family)
MRRGLKCARDFAGRLDAANRSGRRAPSRNGMDKRWFRTPMRSTSLTRAVRPGLRRALHLYWRFARGLTLGVRGIVIDGSGRVFLVKHTYVDGWHFPGGGVEPGETVRDALDRELLEEGNIRTIDAPVLHGIFYNPGGSRRDHIAVFVVRSFRQEGVPEPGREIIEHGFFSPRALPEDTTLGTRRRLAEVLDGVAVSERW